jgi:hypothetical protein
VEVWFKLTIALHESSMGRRMMRYHHYGLSAKTPKYCTINYFYHLDLWSIMRANRLKSSNMVSGPPER